MAWQRISNADQGRFETAPGTINPFAPISADRFYAGWEIFVGAGFGNPLSDSDDSFQGGKSAYVKFLPNHLQVGPNRIFREFRFQAVANKYYRIRAYINPVITSENAKAQSLPLSVRPNFPVSKKSGLNFFLFPDVNSGAQPTDDYSFNVTSATRNPTLLQLNESNWNELLMQARATINGPLLFSLNQFFSIPFSFIASDFENAFINFDSVEFFEHDLITITETPTVATFKGADNAAVAINVAGGSGSFTVVWRKNNDLVFQQTVLEASGTRDFTVTNLTPGTYDYLVTDNELGYTSAGSITVAEPSSNLLIVVNKTNVSAAGLTDGSILLSATGDSGTYTFSISPLLGTAVSAAERTNLPPGTYLGLVTDNVNGEARAASIIINEPNSNLQITLTKKDVTIPGLSNGEITANAFGDTGNYAFSISPSTAQQQGNVFTGLAVGTYTVTVTDLNSSGEATAQISIVAPDALSIVVDTQQNNPCFESEQGALTVTASGGTAPYTYLWNSGTSGRSVIGLSTGNHQVRVTDNVGYSVVFTRAITSPPRIVINIEKSGTQVIVAISGGVTPYTVLWSDGSTQLQRTLPIGNYLVQVTDANGCTKSTTVEITDFKFYFSKNPVWIRRVTDPESKANLSWDADVFVEEEYNTGNFVSIFEANHPALQDGSTVFDFAEILKGQLALLLPALSDAIPQLMANSFRRFYVQTNEKYGNPPVAQTSSVTETFHILMGGLSREEYAANDFFSVFLASSKTPFFSWEAMAKTVYQDQPEYLTFPIVNLGSNEISLLIEAYNQENEIIFTQQGASIGDLQPFMLVNFPVGFTQLGFNALVGGSNIAYYTITVINQNIVQISETKYYHINRNSHNSRKYFIYENALGSWATMVAEGSVTGALQVEMDMIKRPEKFGYVASERTEITENKVLQRSYSYAAGNYLSEETFILADFIRSENVYLYTNKRFKPVIVGIDGDWFNDFDDSTPFEFTVQFEMDKNWTPDVFRVDNRKITPSNEVQVINEFGNVKQLQDYGFENAVPEWNLSSLNKYHSRNATEKRTGAASMQFLTTNYQGMRFDNQIYYPATANNSKAVLVVGLRDLAQSNRKNIIRIWVKSPGRNYAGIAETLGRNLSTVIRVKLAAENFYKTGWISIGNQFQLDNTNGSFNSGWVQMVCQVNIPDKNVYQNQVVEDITFEVFYAGQRINEVLSSMPIYFDDFAITFENI